MKLELIKIKYNKEKNTEEFAPLHLDLNDVTCLYEDSRGVYVVTKQGFLHKVNYKMYLLQNIFKDLM